jgi:hypothetical protein
MEDKSFDLKTESNYSSDEDTLEMIRTNAFLDSQKYVDANDQNFIAAATEKITSKSLSAIKKKLQIMKKQKMRVIEIFVCDKCDKPIFKEDQGFVIHGNIYAANVKFPGGMIGNNFPEGRETFNIEEVQKTVFCKDCFMQVLNIHQYDNDSLDQARYFGKKY